MSKYDSYAANTTIWDEDDVSVVYKSLWLMNYQIPDFDNEYEKDEYYIELFRILMNTLPKREINRLRWPIDNLKLNLKIQRHKEKFHSLVADAVRDMWSKMYDHICQKDKILMQTNYSLLEKETSFKEYREQLKRYEESKYLSYDRLQYFTPIEMLEYVGFSLMKYEKLQDDFYIMLKYPPELNKEPIILHDKDAVILEAKGEQLFESEIDKYLKLNSNPYGDKSFVDIDISNIENVMNADGDDPLDSDIF